MHHPPINTYTDPSDKGSGTSCFASRLRRYADLSTEEAGFIARMEEAERPASRGTVIVAASAPTEELFVLKEGWAIASSRDVGGRRQTLRVFLPGEVIGLPGLGVRRAPHEVRMVTDGIVCPFAKKEITEVFERAPRLAALFAAISGLDHISMSDRLAMMGAGDARQRMAHFLVDIHERLLIANPSLGKRFRLPLRQVDIAEVLGLTKVYVNRLLKAFSDERLIEIERPYVRILEPAEMRRISGYHNRYEDLDNSWFPPRRLRNGS